MAKYLKACDRIGWHRHYVDRYNTNQSQYAEHMACWFLLLHLAFDEPEQAPTS